MASKIVWSSTVEKKLLIGGLEWRLLRAEGNPASHLRSHAKDLVASFAATAVGTAVEEAASNGKKKATRRIAAGYYTSSDNTKAPVGAHSLAAAFARWAHEHSIALLNVRLPADGRHAVVVVVDGIPVLDQVVENASAAVELGRSYHKQGASVFSDDLVQYPNAIAHEDLLEQISEWTSKETAIRAIPVDLVMLCATILTIAAIAGGWVAWSKWDAEQKRLAAIEKQKAEDPIPKYLAGLAAARQDVGIQRPSITSGMDFAKQIPLAPEGWNASRISCTQGLGCEVLFRRTTGTFNGLSKGEPLLSLSPAGSLNLNEAHMTWRQDLGTASLAVEPQSPDIVTFFQGPEASKLQDWLVAGLTIQISPQQLWPQVAGVPPGFRHPEALAIGKFEIDGIALPQMHEVVTTAPPNVHWTSWAIELGDEKQEPLSRAKGRLTGNYYVKNN